MGEPANAVARDYLVSEGIIDG